MNKRKSNLVATVAIAVVLPACASTAQISTTIPASADRIRAAVDYLADDRLEGRGVATAGLDSAAGWLANQFREAGLQPMATGDFYQTFTIDPTAPAAIHAGPGVAGASVKNIVGQILGAGRLATQTVIIGAHYDHLGYGGRASGSLDPDSVGVIHNGADDNASGTATMLEIARLMKARGVAASQRTLVFVAFTAEELGLIGSAHYVANPITPNDSAIAMLNLDMVGRLRDRKLAAFGAETATEFPALLDSINQTHGLEVAASGDGFGRSDQQSFYAQGMPVLHFFTGTHTEYHRTIDDSPTINTEGAAQVAHFIADLATALATTPDRLEFKDAPPPPTITSSGSRPWLGTIPDMTSSPGGVLLSGVTSGSPADEAGMQQGDVLTKLGDHDIGDLYDMTNALNAYKPGDTITIVVRRGEELVELTATLRSRSE